MLSDAEKNKIYYHRKRQRLIDQGIHIYQRPNYKINTFCAVCNKIYPKDCLWCTDCGRRVRRKTRDHKSREEMPRY